jgi:hypothetical protein
MINQRTIKKKKGIGPILVSALLFLAIFMIAANNIAINPVSAATPPTLVASASYSVLAASTITNTNTPTHVSGTLGGPPCASITGFPPGTIGPPGVNHCNDANAAAAQADFGTAYISLNTLNPTCDQSFAADQELTLLGPIGPGVYCDSGPTGFHLTGTLYLSGSGVWVFKSDKELIVASNSKIVGGDPCNVWWREGSDAIIGTGAQMIGNIFVGTSITLNSGSTLNGRAFASTAAVTLDNTAVGGPTCASGSTLSTITYTVTNGGLTTTITTTVAILLFQMIAEYPWGVLLLIILMLPVYMLFKRRNQNSTSKSPS